MDQQSRIVCVYMCVYFFYSSVSFIFWELIEHVVEKDGSGERGGRRERKAGGTMERREEAERVRAGEREGISYPEYCI